MWNAWSVSKASVLNALEEEMEEVTVMDGHRLRITLKPLLLPHVKLHKM